MKLLGNSLYLHRMSFFRCEFELYANKPLSIFGQRLPFKPFLIPRKEDPVKAGVLFGTQLAFMGYSVSKNDSFPDREIFHVTYYSTHRRFHVFFVVCFANYRRFLKTHFTEKCDQCSVDKTKQFLFASKSPIVAKTKFTFDL